MASLEEKQKLIRAIKNPVRYFRLTFGRYGGEVAMGTITREQYEYWADTSSESFGDYMRDVDYDVNEANKDIPKEAQFEYPFYEYGNLCHISGVEWAGGQTLWIEEVDKDGHTVFDDQGYPVQDIRHDFDDLESLGVEVKCIAEHTPSSKSCRDHHYIFGQYFNKGGWSTPDIIKTNSEGFDVSQMKIGYENCDGFKVFGEIEYRGEHYSLEEVSTGKSSTFYVQEGDNA